MIDAAATDLLVGYRLSVATGSSEASECIVAVDASGRHVSLTRYADATAAGRAVRALARASGPHVQVVLDVGTAPNGDIVVVTRLTPIALDALLATRRALTPPEVVTVLVPVVEALGRIHQSGVALSDFGAASVRFDASGSPSLTGFDRAVLRCGAVGAVDERFAAAVSADRAGLTVLAGRLLRPVGGGEIADRVVRSNGDTEGIVDALFAWANPAPIRFDASDVPSELPRSSERSGTPGRIIALAAVPSADDGQPAVRDPRPPGALHRAAGSLRARCARLHVGVVGGVRQVRGRVWVACGAIAVLLVAAVVLLPGHGADAATRSAGAQTDTSPAPQRTQAELPARTYQSAGAADDPLRAFVALRDARGQCLAAGSAPCLNEVDSPASPVAQQDADAISAGVAAVAVPAANPVLRARSGSTATIAAGSVTVLLVRDQGRWRFRDVIGSPP